jgi:hypothetical protein
MEVGKSLQGAGSLRLPRPVQFFTKDPVPASGLKTGEKYAHFDRCFSIPSDEHETEHKNRYSKFSHQQRRGNGGRKLTGAHTRDPIDRSMVGRDGEEFHGTCAYRQRHRFVSELIILAFSSLLHEVNFTLPLGSR